MAVCVCDLGRAFRDKILQGCVTRLMAVCACDLGRALRDKFKVCAEQCSGLSESNYCTLRRVQLYQVKGEYYHSLVQTQLFLIIFNHWFEFHP